MISALLQSAVHGESFAEATCRVTVVEPDSATGLKTCRGDTLRKYALGEGDAVWPWQVGAQKAAPQVAQDALQLLEAVLPVLPLHSGDVGLPRFVGVSGLPPRLVGIRVNGVRWIPGVYGLVDVTGVPEALDGRVLLHSYECAFPSSLTRQALGFSLIPRPTDFLVPLSSINFVRGPFGGDVLRAWIARRLSPRLTIHFTLDQANSSGQFLQMPYDGQKISGDARYALGHNAALRYLFLSSKNEAGRTVPFYAEEQSLIAAPGSGQLAFAGFGKEQRAFHALEFSMPAFFVRTFYWNLNEEFRGQLIRVRHRIEQAGLEAGFQANRARWVSQLRAAFHDERTTSTSITLRRAQVFVGKATFAWCLTDYLRARVDGTMHKEADWPAAFEPEVDFSVALPGKIQLHAILARRAINPAPAEFANTLATLQGNADLQPAALLRAALAVQWQAEEKGRLQIRSALNRLQAPFAVDTLMPKGQAGLRNANHHNVPSIDGLLEWQLSRALRLGGSATWMLNSPPTLFWYWYVPRGFARAYIELQQDFFRGDLDTRFRLVWRQYGSSQAPIYDQTSLPKYVPVAGGGMADVQLFLRHGSGTVYFSFENVFDADLEWRPGVAAPGRFLKWGVSWDFRN